MCTARALVERASKSAAAAAAARAEAKNPMYFPSHEGATAVPSGDGPSGNAGRRRAQCSSASVSAAVDAAVAAVTVPVTRLRDAYAALCHRKLMAPIAISEFNDILDRVVVRR